MKKLLFIAAAAAMLCSCTSKPKYTVVGNIAGLEGTVYMFEGDSLIASTAVDAGKFRFKGIFEAPAMRLLSDSPQRRSQTFMVQFILEEGTITISPDPENPARFFADGTPANAAMNAYIAESRALMSEAPDPAKFEELSRNTVDVNRDNFFGVLLFPQIAYNLSGTEMLDEIAKFTPEMQATSMMTKLKEQAEQKIKTDIGQPFIEIVQPDAQGNAISLSSVVNNPKTNYVLLDFWAAWCGPCMAEVPHLKQTYDKYASQGFEIYAVSFDNDRDKWLAAAKQNAMNWIHVSEVTGFDNQAAKDYAIQGIPANFLIDMSGTIIAKNLRGEDLYKKIEELLEK